MCGLDTTRLILKSTGECGRERNFYSCKTCGLIFVDPDHRLLPDEEFQRYELHENDPADEAYRKFLNRMFIPLNRKLLPGSRGLDFGSGPGPTLHLMFEAAGHTVRNFDKFYANDHSVFDESYDFITTTETVEHLFEPLFELDRLWSSLAYGGWLGIMTSLVPDNHPFAEWHYIRDDTHVTFFSRKTFFWLGERWRSKPEFHESNVMLFHKPSET